MMNIVLSESREVRTQAVAVNYSWSLLECQKGQLSKQLHGMTKLADRSKEVIITVWDCSTVAATVVVEVAV